MDFSAVLAILLSLPVFHEDLHEAESARRARLGVIAQATLEASSEVHWPGSRDELAALLVTQAYFETRLSRRIHAGNCRDDECDEGRAVSLWQLQFGPHLPRSRWEQMRGSGPVPTRKSAVFAAEVLTRARRYCGSIEGAIALYATGKTCRLPLTKARYRMFQRILSKLRS